VSFGVQHRRAAAFLLSLCLAFQRVRFLISRRQRRRAEIRLAKAQFASRNGSSLELAGDSPRRFEGEAFRDRGGAAKGSAWDDEAEILAFGELGGAFRAMCKRLPLLDGRGTFGASNPPLALMNDDRLK